MDTSLIRVLVADDHGVVREGIRHVLEREPGFVVVAAAGTAAEAIRLAVAYAPDVAVVDISMPGGSGLDAVGRIRASLPGTRVLMLSMHDNPEYLRESVRAGAHGYLLKDSAGTELRAAVRAVHAGGEYFSEALTTRAGAEASATAVDSRLGVLSGREREVLAGIARGRTNKEIAAELGISHRTVETHRESLMRKLDIRTVAGLTKLALEEGIVEGL